MCNSHSGSNHDDLIAEVNTTIDHACQVITSKLAWMKDCEYSPEYESICHHVKQIKASTNWVRTAEALARSEMRED